MAPRRRSVRTEIVAGFAAVILAFGAVATWSLVRQRRAVASMRLANETYLLLALRLVEIRVAQSMFITRLESLTEPGDRVVSRTWLGATRRTRRVYIQANLLLVRSAIARVDDADDRAFLQRAAATLMGIDADYAIDEPRLEEFFESSLATPLPETLSLRADLLARESSCADRLYQLTREVQARVHRLTDGLERRQRQAVQLTLAAIAVACVLGAISAVTALRALRPLTRLRDRALAVARGDLQPVAVDADNDEIGELATEFERMVGAVAARDAALRKAHEDVVQAERLAAIGRMAAHVTHEVRNPLSSIALNAEMLHDEVADGAPEAARLVRAIQREVDRLTGLTEEYLRMARLPKPRLEREDLAAVVSDAATFVAREMETARVRLRVVAEPEVPAVRLDEGQFRQCLLNLLRNAREAMEVAGADDASITLRVRAEQGGAAVDVCDAGAGLSEQALAHLYELFYTTKERGSGLGLPLTREIVTAHGGTIRVDRAPVDDGGGARFTIWLPAAPGDDEETSDAE
jgi:two-component system NtrC family sensor kinase